MNSNKKIFLIDFQHTALPTTPNYYFVCPKGYANVEPNSFAQIYSVDIATLKQYWDKLVLNLSRIKCIAHDEAIQQYTYIQRTPYLRFPDYINVKLIEIDASHSSIAILRQTKYGYSDLGMNKRRVNAILESLTKCINNAL